MKQIFTYDEALRAAKRVSDEAVTIVLEAVAAIVAENLARGQSVSDNDFIEMLRRVGDIYSQGVDIKPMFDKATTEEPRQ
jgi:hypothetical protein